MPTKVKYPNGWKYFSYWIRFFRANGQCECVGECGLHKTTPGPRRCSERNGHFGEWAKGTVVLTVAHLCKCDPPCMIESHVKAMCNRCHLRVDVEQHVANSRDTRAKKRLAKQPVLEMQI